MVMAVMMMMMMQGKKVATVIAKILVEDEKAVIWALMKVFHKLNEKIHHQMNIPGDEGQWVFWTRAESGLDESVQCHSSTCLWEE